MVIFSIPVNAKIYTLHSQDTLPAPVDDICNANDEVKQIVPVDWLRQRLRPIDTDMNLENINQYQCYSQICCVWTKYKQRITQRPL